MNTRRLVVFLLSTFLITWICWWSLARLAGSGVMVYGEPLFMILYLIGGFGPTFAAYISVVTVKSTPESGSEDDRGLREFHRRLFRVKVSPLWYAAALAGPFILHVLSTGIASAVSEELRTALAFQPWYMVFPTLLIMVIGGGLEELGWRGVMVPEVRKRYNPLVTGLCIGVIWAVWHLPLFYIPGVGQYGMNFAVFFLGTFAPGFLLLWIYEHTESVFMCVLFHAAWNAALGMGFMVPTEYTWAAWIDAGMKVAIGILVLLLLPARGVDTK